MDLVHIPFPNPCLLRIPCVHLARLLQTGTPPSASPRLSRCAPRQSSTLTRGPSGTRREHARTGNECAEFPVGRHDDVSADSFSEDEYSRTSRAPGRGGGRAGGRGASSSGNNREKGAASSGRDGVDRANRHGRRPGEKCIDEDSTENESKDEPTDSCTDDDFSENEEASDGSEVDGSDDDGSDNDGSSNRSSPRSSDRRHTGRDSNGSSRRRSDSRSSRSPESTRSPRSPESTRSPRSLESRRSLSSPESTQSPRDAKSWSGPDDNASSNEYAEKYVVRNRTRASAVSVDYSQRAPAGHYVAEHEQERHQHRQPRISAPPPPQHKRYASAAAVPAKHRSASLNAASLDQAAAAIAGASGGDEPAELMHGSNAAYASTGGGNCGARLPAGNAAGGRLPSAQARSMRKCISGDRATMGSGSMDLDRCKQGGLGIGHRGAAGGSGGCNAPRPSGNQPGNQQCPQPVRQNVRPSVIARSMSVPDDELERTPSGGYQQQHGPSHRQGEERRVKAQAARNAVRVVELGGPAEGSPVPHAVAVTAAGALTAGAGGAGGAGGAAGEMGAVAVAGHGKKGHLRGFFASWGGH
ncbi:unnamed protein product [Closterium sp. Yama58-4]|nr:unnamed protein product [Closterium sp. Yama58-4]